MQNSKILKDIIDLKLSYQTASLENKLLKYVSIDAKPIITGEFITFKNLTVDINSKIKSFTGDSNDNQYTYQWLRGDVNIDGANATSYTLTLDDLDKKIKVTVTSKSIPKLVMVSEPTSVVQLFEDTKPLILFNTTPSDPHPKPYYTDHKILHIYLKV